MTNELSRNIKVGVIVLAGTAFLIIALYFIGDKQNLFGSTFRVNARFYNVNGLTPGNNVRLSGIDVGTVENVEITSDSSVKVVMLIEQRVRRFIKKNAKASIGTDGLMGNKLVNINSGGASAASIEDGDELQALKPIETDEMLRTLNATNENIRYITNDLKKITQRINSPNTLWNILMDTVVAENVKKTIVNIRLTSNHSAIISGDLGNIVKEVKAGKGSIGSLLTDTTFSGKLEQSIVNIRLITDKLGVITGDLGSVSQRMKNGEGAVGTLLMDTSFVRNLTLSMQNVKEGSQGFSENMEALKHSVFLRRYFKKQEKTKKK